MAAKKTVGVLEKRRHQIFMRRSYSMYRDLEKRANEGKKEKVKLIFTLEHLRKWVQDALGQPCPYLSYEKITVRNFSLDHKMPISRGGHATAESNLLVCSRSANHAKGELMEQEFYDLMALMEGNLANCQEWPREAQQDVIGRLKAGAAIKRLKFLGRKAHAVTAE